MRNRRAEDQRAMISMARRISDLGATLLDHAQRIRVLEEKAEHPLHTLPAEPIDHEDLLRRYMVHVRQRFGISAIYETRYNPALITQQQTEELERLAELGMPT